MKTAMKITCDECGYEHDKAIECMGCGCILEIPESIELAEQDAGSGASAGYPAERLPWRAWTIKGNIYIRVPARPIEGLQSFVTHKIPHGMAERLMIELRQSLPDNSPNNRN